MPTSLNSACDCCRQPSGCAITLAGVIISQQCSDSFCSFRPCTSITNRVCEPNYVFSNFTPETHCLRYLVETSVNSGITNTSTYSRLNPENPEESCIGVCQIRTCCSGSRVTTTNTESTAQYQYQSVATPLCEGTFTTASMSGSADQTTEILNTYSCSGCRTLEGTKETEFTLKYSTTETRQCQGTASMTNAYSNPGPCSTRPNCSSIEEQVEYNMSLSNVGPNQCAWSGTYTRSDGCWADAFFDPDYWTDDLTGPLGVYPRPPASQIVSNIYDIAEYFQRIGSSNGSFSEETTVDVQPPISPITTNTYSSVKQGCDLCKEIEFPEFPNDALSCEDRRNGVPLPELEVGQGYNGTDGSNYADYGGYTKSYTAAKVRLEHTIPETCYLKVWIRETTQKYKTGESSCVPTELDGDPSFKDYIYEWKGTSGCNKTCLKNCQKLSTACENEIYSEQTWMADPGPPENGKAKTISLDILKYSFVPDYIPDDPDTVPYCNPNGFPSPASC